MYDGRWNFKSHFDEQSEEKSFLVFVISNEVRNVYMNLYLPKCFEKQLFKYD